MVGGHAPGGEMLNPALFRLDVTRRSLVFPEATAIMQPNRESRTKTRCGG